MLSLWTKGGLTWRELGWRLLRQVWAAEILGRCAELAYYFLFSVFPLLLFLTTLLGYLADTNAELRASLFLFLSRISPTPDVTALLYNTLAEITRERGGAKLSLSLVAAVWVASNGMIAVARTLNAAYGLTETRPWWERRLWAMALTVAVTGLIVAGLGVIFYGGEIGEMIAQRLGLTSIFTYLWRLLKWPLALCFLYLSLEVIYNFAPNLKGAAKRHWGSPGALVSLLLWLFASLGLRVYLARFHGYTTAYGSLGAVILLMIWFYLIGFAILMGGGVNSEIGKALAERPPKRATLSPKRQGKVRVRRK